MEDWKNDIRFRWLAAGGLAVVASWTFYAQSIAPLRQREKEARHSIAALKGQLADAREPIGAVRELEARVSRERGELNSLLKDLPAGSAMIWLPELVKGHFGSFGIAVEVVRLNTAVEEPGLPGYQRVYWSVALPIGEAARNVTGLLRAVAELEQQNSFVKVLDFSVQPNPENPGLRMGALNVAALVRK